MVVAKERRHHHVTAGSERFSVLHDNSFDGCHPTCFRHHLATLNADNLRIAARLLRFDSERCQRVGEIAFCAIAVKRRQYQSANGI